MNTIIKYNKKNKELNNSNNIGNIMKKQLIKDIQIAIATVSLNLVQENSQILMMKMNNKKIQMIKLFIKQKIPKNLKTKKTIMKNMISPFSAKLEDIYINTQFIEN